MARTHRTESSAFHGCGSTRRRRYSQGRTRRASRPALTPPTYASMRARSRASKRATTLRATARNRWTLTSESTSTVAEPISSESSPAARRLRRSIWKNRSWPCRNPVARATSTRAAPLTVATPFWSRSTVTGPSSPFRERAPSRVGREPRMRRVAPRPATRTRPRVRKATVRSVRRPDRILMEPSVLEESAEGGQQVGLRGEHLLERLRERDGRVGAAQAGDRGVEIVEGLLGNRGRDLGAETAGERSLVQDQHLRGPPDRGEDGLLVPGQKSAQVDDLDLGAFRRERGCRVEGPVDGRTVGHDGEIAARSRDPGLPDGGGEVALGHQPLQGAIEELVLHEEDGIRLGQGGEEEALRVYRGRRRDHAEAGHVG